MVESISYTEFVTFFSQETTNNLLIVMIIMIIGVVIFFTIVMGVVTCQSQLQKKEMKMAKETITGEQIFPE